MIKQQLYDGIIVGAGPVALSLGIFLAKTKYLFNFIRRLKNPFVFK